LKPALPVIVTVASQIRLPVVASNTVTRTEAVAMGGGHAAADDPHEVSAKNTNNSDAQAERVIATLEASGAGSGLIMIPEQATAMAPSQKKIQKGPHASWRSGIELRDE
jgi:hypothetical protein